MMKFIKRFMFVWNKKLLGKVKNESDKEADARAKMLIYLIENGLMKNE